MLIGHIQCDKSLSLILLFAYETQLCASPWGCWNTSILVAACYDSQLVQALAPSAKNHNALWNGEKVMVDNNIFWGYPDLFSWF